MPVFILTVLAVAVAGINVLRGGIFLLLSLPCYALLSFAAILSQFRPVTLKRTQTTNLALASGGIFFGYVLIRTVGSPVEYLARTDLFMTLGAVMVYLLVALHLPSPNKRAALLTILLLLSLANCVIGAIQFTKGNDFMPFAAFPRLPYGTRISGFLGSPNHLAGFLEVTSLLGLAMTCWSSWRIWAKILLGYSSLVSLTAIVFTGSRGGYASVTVGLLVFAVLSLLILSRQKFDRLGYVIATIGLGVLFVGSIVYAGVSQSHSFRSRIETVTTLDDARMRIWPSAIKQFQTNPLVGTGAGTFLYYGREFRDPLIQTDPRYTHNDYLQLLAEYGIIGLTWLAVFLVAHLWSAWKAVVSAIEQHCEFEPVGNTSMALSVGALSSTAALMVHSIVDFNLHIPSNALLMAFVFGVLANPSASTASFSGDKVIPMGWPVRLLLPALGLWTIFTGLPKLPGAFYVWKAREALGDWTTLETGEYAVRAERFARQGLLSDPTNTDLLNFLGEALFHRAALSKESTERNQLLEESIAYYRQALKLAPQDRNLVLALGWSLDAAQRLDEADAVFARAVSLDPNSGAVLAANAAHLRLQGKLSEAKAEFEKAIRLGGGPFAEMGLRAVTEELQAKAAAPAPSFKP